MHSSGEGQLRIRGQKETTTFRADLQNNVERNGNSSGLVRVVASIESWRNFRNAIDGCSEAIARKGTRGVRRNRVLVMAVFNQMCKLEQIAGNLLGRSINL